MNVLYQKSSRFNPLLVTERCNSFCVMCSQPPKDRDDGFLVAELLQAIPLRTPETPGLGITGGEPTLLHGRLLEIIAAARDHLPGTALHLLSNGRLFAYLDGARAIAELNHLSSSSASRSTPTCPGATTLWCKPEERLTRQSSGSKSSDAGHVRSP